MKKKTNLIKICMFLLALAPVMISNTASPLLIGEPKLPIKYH